MTGAPTAGDAATAAGNSDPNRIAKVAARNASDFLSDQYSADGQDTHRPVRRGLAAGQPLKRRRLDGIRKRRAGVAADPPRPGSELRLDQKVLLTAIE